ncbi:MAG: hypothetical protein HY517_00250 [Candidatus Aenigmarchaeota archaeon]|nr:hypothetical protein [Candidatus Aenigmarchaeota archaeon]
MALKDMFRTVRKKKKEEKSGIWILEDLSRHPLRGDVLNKDLDNKSGPKGEWLGHVIAAGPFEAHVQLDFTGPPGSVSGIYYSLFFQLGKWEYLVQKRDEWIEVSPVHAQYYQLTQKQKEELEGRIKQGLVSVSQSVADMELLMHDRRRYHEFLHYLGYRTPSELKKMDKKLEKQEEGHQHVNEEMDEICLKEDDDEDERKTREKRTDNHSLKAVFIDQVDMHTGEGISMRSIVSRWPTLITDFMRMSDDDMDPDKVKDNLQVSKAEAVVLITKNKLYQEWKRIFGPEIKNRYITINELAGARKKSVDEYKEWLKPFIARHRLIKEGLASPGNRGSMLTSFITTGGTATSSSKIKLWVWKDFLVPELYKGGSEDTGKLRLYEKLRPDDDWTMKHLIFNKKYGIVNRYPWITEEWVREKAKEMRDKDRWFTFQKPYYSFFEITLSKTNIRMPTGDEMEDGVFDINMFCMSENALFAKLLELKAEQEEMEQHVNKLLGVSKPLRGTVPKYYHAKEKENAVSKALGKLSMSMSFAKNHGPYERDFADRLTKIYFARIAGERYGPIVNFIKMKMGMKG